LIPEDSKRREGTGSYSHGFYSGFQKVKRECISKYSGLDP
jgi:hypothetical protein